MKITYQVWVEGSLHDEFTTKQAANNKALEFENEGWNRVQVTRVEETETVQDTANKLNKLFGF